MRHQLGRALTGVVALGLLAGNALRAQEIPLPGQDNTAFGTTSAEFLLLGAGARGAALGPAFSAIATDVSALYWNPGSLAELERPGAMVGVYDYVADTRYSWGGVAFPFNDGQTVVGFQVGSFGFGDQPIYTVAAPDGDGTTYSVRQTFIGGTLSQNFSDRFSSGLTVKYVSDRLGQTSASAVAVDFGTSFHATIGGRPIRAAFVIHNLGTTLKHTGPALATSIIRPQPPGQDQLPQDPQPAVLNTKDFSLPTVFRVSLSYDVLNSALTRLTVLSEFSQPNNSNPTAGGGMEWAAMLGSSGFSVLAPGSYTYQPDNALEGDLGNVAGFSSALGSREWLDGLAVGGGLVYDRGSFGVGLDYAYRHLGLLGGTNVFSASISW